MLLGYAVFWLPPSLFALFRFLSLIFGGLFCPKRTIWSTRLIPCSLNILSCAGAFLLLNLFLLCGFAYLSFCIPMKSNKNQLNKFAFTISSLCIFSTVLGHSSMYHFCLNFHLITSIHISLCSCVVSKKVQLTNYIISSVNSIFTADQMNLFCLFCMKLCWVTALWAFISLLTSSFPCTGLWCPKRTSWPTSPPQSTPSLQLTKLIFSVYPVWSCAGPPLYVFLLSRLSSLLSHPHSLVQVCGVQ